MPHSDSRARLRNARNRLDSVLDDLPPAAAHHVATMVHNITDAIVEAQKATVDRLKAAPANDEQPKKGKARQGPMSLYKR